jgi:hypothetical protein
VLDQLDRDYQRIVEKVAEGVEKRDYSLSLQIDKLDEFLRR